MVIVSTLEDRPLRQTQVWTNTVRGCTYFQILRFDSANSFASAMVLFRRLYLLRYQVTELILWLVSQDVEITSIKHEKHLCVSNLKFQVEAQGWCTGHMAMRTLGAETFGGTT